MKIKEEKFREFYTVYRYQLRTSGEWRTKKSENFADVIYGWSLTASRPPTKNLFETKCAAARRVAIDTLHLDARSERASERAPAEEHNAIMNVSG